MAFEPQSFHPYGPPTVSDSEFTVDYMLQTPNIITEAIMDLTEQRFIVDRLFTLSNENAAGGALLYSELEENEVYPERDIEEVLPGEEFPRMAFRRPTLMVELARKWGGTFEVTDEAVKYNRMNEVQKAITQVSNALVRKQNAIALGKAIAKIKASQSFVANNWTTVQDSYHPDYLPIADLARIPVIAEDAELGVNFDTLILNGSDKATLRVNLRYGGGFDQNLQDFGFGECFSTPRVAAGTGFAVERGGLGPLVMDEPIQTVTWREEGRQVTNVTVFMIPLVAVTNSFAIVRMTGLR